MNVVPISPDETRAKWQTGLKQATFILGMWFLLMFVALLIIFPFEFPTCVPPEKIAIQTWCFKYNNTSLIFRDPFGDDACPSLRGLVEFSKNVSLNRANGTINCWYIDDCQTPPTVFLSIPIYVQQQHDYEYCINKNAHNKSNLEYFGGFCLTIIGLFFISLFSWLVLKYKKRAEL